MQRGIGYITSILGNPLSMDQIITNQQKVAYAKVCIEIKAGLDVPRNIKEELRDGSVVLVNVEVPWMPAMCFQ